jgi:hypothetical protein
VRKEWSKKARAQYPDKIPIILEPYNEKAPQIKNPKFLMPITFRIGEVLAVLRKKLSLNKNDTLILYVLKSASSKYKMVTNETSVRDLYANFKDPKDEMLYFVYA